MLHRFMLAMPAPGILAIPRLLTVLTLYSSFFRASYASPDLQWRSFQFHTFFMYPKSLFARVQEVFYGLLLHVRLSLYTPTYILSIWSTLDSETILSIRREAKD